MVYSCEHVFVFSSGFGDASDLGDLPDHARWSAGVCCRRLVPGLSMDEAQDSKLVLLWLPDVCQSPRDVPLQNVHLFGVEPD